VTAHSILPLSSFLPAHRFVLQKYTNEEAVLRLLKDGKEVTASVKLAAPVKLIPFHIKGRPPR
jgi:hypothetical protein